MQIKMIGTFSYDVVPGSTRRTLHQGLVLEEASDVATAAINAGKAVRWPLEQPLLDDAVAGDDGGDDGGDGAGDQTPNSPAPEPAKKPSGKKAAAKTEAPAQPAGEPSPAEAVEPGDGG